MLCYFDKLLILIKLITKDFRLSDYEVQEIEELIIIQ